MCNKLCNRNMEFDSRTEPSCDFIDDTWTAAEPGEGQGVVYRYTFLDVFTVV
jgi:hypothetical protein